MKVASRNPRRPGIDLRSQSFSLSKAKTFLGRLIEKASKGEPVYILRGERRFILQEMKPIDPIPMRPAGYFSSTLTKEEIESDNELAKASVVRPPKDLE